MVLISKIAGSSIIQYDTSNYCRLLYSSVALYGTVPLSYSTRVDYVTRTRPLFYRATTADYRTTQYDKYLVRTCTVGISIQNTVEFHFRKNQFRHPGQKVGSQLFGSQPYCSTLLVNQLLMVGASYRSNVSLFGPSIWHHQATRTQKEEHQHTKIRTKSAICWWCRWEPSYALFAFVQAAIIHCTYKL